MTDDADRQVTEVLKEVHAAWDANDADAFAEPYAESATATLFAGDLKGSRNHDGQ